MVTVMVANRLSVVTTVSSSETIHNCRKLLALSLLAIALNAVSYTHLTLPTN